MTLNRSTNSLWLLSDGDPDYSTLGLRSKSPGKGLASCLNPANTVDVKKAIYVES